MFDLGLGEILVIAVLVIVFVGPDGLPDMMRVLGRFYAQIRRASDDLRRTFNAEVARVESDRRRDELRERRLARERARAEERAARGEAPPATAEEEPEELLALAPDPRLPLDAAPRAAPLPRAAAPRPPVAGAAPRPAPGSPPVPAAPPAASPTFDGSELAAPAPEEPAKEP